MWGHFPGRVRLEILSERLLKTGASEELLVRWRTCPPSSSDNEKPLSRGSSSTESGIKINHTPISSPESEEDEGNYKGFTGLFIFTFDESGKIASLTIEHADENWGGHENPAARIVGVAEWLLRKARLAGEGGKGEPGFAFVREEEGEDVRRLRRGEK